VHYIHTTPRKVAYSLFFELSSREIPDRFRNYLAIVRILFDTGAPSRNVTTAGTLYCRDNIVAGNKFLRMPVSVSIKKKWY